MLAKLKAAALGATGYAGVELARLLLHHPRLDKPIFLRRQGDEAGPQNLAEVFLVLSGNGGCPLEPGCYPTSVILALAPLLRAGLVDRDRGIISDSKSGVSGAGKEPSSRTHFVSVAENGGGTALTRTLKYLGKESAFVNGLRITDAETRDVAIMVLAGIVNKTVVAAISVAGRPAIGLCGGDGASFRARKKQTDGCDLGFVGEIALVECRWLEAIWTNGGIPVIASVALGSDREYYNVNADQMAAACAVACHANALIFLTDVPGVRNADGSVIPWLDLKQIAVLAEGSIIGGGMIPKLEACGHALKRGVHRVRILPAAQADVLPQFYFSKLDCGTEVIVA